METHARQARLLRIQNARQRYTDAVNRRAPAEVVRYFQEQYIQACEHHASASIDESSWGHKHG